MASLFFDTTRQTRRAPSGRALPYACGTAARCCMQIFSLLALASAASVTLASAAHSVHVPPDHNSRVQLLDFRPVGESAHILYATYPDRGDRRYGERCAVAAHVATVPPALTPVAAQTLSSDLCGMLGLDGKLLNNGDTLLLHADGITRWHDGNATERLDFSALPALRGIDIDPTSAAQAIDSNTKGEVLLAWVDSASAGKSTLRAVRTASIAGLAGAKAWRSESVHPDWQVSLIDAWIDNTGGALAHIRMFPAGGNSIALREALVPFDADGQVGEPVIIAADRQPTLEQQAAIGGDLQKLKALLTQSYSESIRTLIARPRAEGGFDVLLNRASGSDSREGHFLLRIGTNGRELAEHNLSAAIEEHGLSDWADFRVEDDTLLLLSQVSATQPGITARRSRYPQNVVSHIALPGGPPLSRLLPLERQYLQAAMNARDEDVQTLADHPGGRPLALFMLNGQPLAVSAGYRSRRHVLTFDAATAALPRYTEAFDQQQREKTAAQERAARKANREARSQALSADIAAASGMSPDDFAALSRREQQEQMLRHGDLNAIMGLAAAQAAAAQQAMASSGQAGAAGISPDTLAAMQQAMSGITAGAPVTVPAPGAAVVASPKSIAMTGKAQTTTAKNDVLPVSASGRAFIEYDTPDGRPVTLVIEQRSDGRELLRKDYPDGSIYENINFNRLGAPLEQLRVKYLDTDGATLEERTPAISR